MKLFLITSNYIDQYHGKNKAILSFDFYIISLISVKKYTLFLMHYIRLSNRYYGKI